MTKREKRLQKLRQNPKNVSFEELRQVLEDYGAILKKTTGSHHHFQIVSWEKVVAITIPYRRPHVGVVYVKQVLELLDMLSQDGMLEQMEETEDNE